MPRTPETKVDVGAFEAALAAAEEACAGGSGAATLDALLGAWRIARAPLLTDAIELLSRRYEAVIPRIEGKTERGRYEQFLDLVARRRALDVPTIVAELPHASLQRAKDHMDRLAVMDPDPRLARALLDPVATRRWNSFHKIWTAVFRELRRHGDARIREAIAAMPLPGDEVAGAENLRARIRHVLERLPVAPALDAPTVARLTRLREAVLDVPLDVPGPAATPAPARDEAALLAEAIANPDDDAVRLVLADVYTERGDVRGEFVQLQIKNARAGSPRTKDVTRERQILRQHLVELLGPVEPIVDRRTCRFERGFLHHAALKLKTAAQRRELLGHPLLGTLASIETRQVAVLRHPNLAYVRAARGLPWKAFVELAHGPPLPRLTSVSVVSDGAPGPEALRHLDGLPALAAIEVVVTGGPDGASAWRWVLEEGHGLLADKALTVTGDPRRMMLGGVLAVLDSFPAIDHLAVGLCHYGDTTPVATLHLTRVDASWDVRVQGAFFHFALSHQHDPYAPWPTVRFAAEVTEAERALPPVVQLVAALGDRLTP